MKSRYAAAMGMYGAGTIIWLLCWGVVTTAAQTGGIPASAAPTPISSCTVVASYPHDTQAFTQGLVYEKGFFYESTGLYGESSLRKVDVKTGKVAKQYDLPRILFGEGLALFNDKLIQLTWRSGIGFVYDKEMFVILRKFSYPTQGWGLTFDGQRLIMSDGSSTLRMLDPDTFAEISTIVVRDHQGPVSQLNELEFVHGEILANVLPTDRIARIDPKTGQVTGWIDCAGLFSIQRPNPVEKPLNGIAYDSENDRLFITGKHWSKVFEILITPGR